MSKHFSLLAFLFCWQMLFSAPIEKNKIEITAKHIESTKNTVDAKENVLVYYQDAVIRANSAHYDKIKKLLILDGKIEMIGYQGAKEHSNHMEIYTESDEVTFDELFLVSKQDVWLYSGDAHKQDGNYTFGASMLSSCDVEDPLWTMTFEHSLYDSQDHYMRMYNAKVYLWDIPMFYTPYMAFTTERKRSSGLLFPTFGLRSSEGLIYEQPIFWAIADDRDLEISPQVRTSRGVGVYGTFRMVDSDHSSGWLRVGSFKDTDTYFKQNNLFNQTHYGLEGYYDSSSVLSGSSDFDFTDGLYISATLMNDIEYLNLQSSALSQFGLSPLQESKFNYFINGDENYVGINAKYFIDTRVKSNDETLQILPSVQFHHYLNRLFLDNLTYSADFKTDNFDRKEGVTLNQSTLKIPLEYTTAFLDDFVNISLGEEVYYSKFFFGNGDFIQDDFEHFNTVGNVKFFTDLTKKYDGFVHVVQPSVSYINAGNSQQSEIKYSSLDTEQQALFVLGIPEDQYNFNVSQYFYDEQMNLKFYQRFIHRYYLDRPNNAGDTGNEMQYNWSKWSLYNNVTYSNAFSTVRDTSTRVTLSDNDYTLGLGHTFKEVLPDALNTISANDVDIRASYVYSKKITLLGGLTYNLDEETSRQWYIGGNYNRECWSLATSVRQDITPRPTGFTTDYAFYMLLNFVPFGSVGTGGQ